MKVTKKKIYYFISFKDLGVLNTSFNNFLDILIKNFDEVTIINSENLRLFTKKIYSYKNKQALDILGFDGTKLKPNYAQVGDDGGILTNKEYLLGNTLNRDQINEAVPDIISGGDSLPDSMVNSYFDNVTSGAFSQSYNDIKARLENQISTSQNGKVHKDNIFYDYLQKEGLLNG